MKIFGKSPGQYVCFEAGLLIFIFVVGVLRFGLFQAGASLHQVSWLSMTVASVVGFAYLGARVHLARFGGYRELLPLSFAVGVVQNWVSAAGVLLAMAMHTDNIFSIPEFANGHDGKTLTHALAHLLAAPVVVGLLGWGLSALTMLLTRLLVRRPTPESETGSLKLEDSPAVEQ